MTRETSELLLVADVGGTHARIGMIGPDEALPSAIEVFNCRDHLSLENAIDSYFSRSGHRRASKGVIAVATRVDGDWVSLTNQSWAFSIERARRRFGFDELLVLNDFAALALAIPHLEAPMLSQIGGLDPKDEAPKALIGPGTGLGVSGLLKCGERWIPLQGEGGHVSYGGFTSREAEIVGVLRERFGNVSAERLVSGPGLSNLYQAICSLGDVPAEPLEAAEITERGCRQKCPACTEALQVFCAALGTVAGDLALTLGATGGVYIGGGILPKLGDYLWRSDFRARFEAHGRMDRYLASIPCYLICAPHATLLGAAKALSSEC